MSVFMIIPPAVLVLVLWWLFLSGLRWRTRLSGIGVLIAGVAVFFGFFRVKEFAGDMVPHFESRWQESSEQKSADYWKNLKTQAPAADGRAPSDASKNAIAAFPIKVGDWPQFEGPNRDGIAQGIKVRTDWDREPPKQLWRHPVGAAWSSFAIVGNSAFTQEQRGDNEAVVCYDAQTGKQIWAHLDPVRHESVLGGVGPRATPTVADSRVYTFGGTGLLNCLDPHTGGVIWSADTLADASTDDAKIDVVQFGMSGSPLVYDNLVVVNPGGKRKSMTGTEATGKAVIAYDRKTGKPVWKAGDYLAGYASPVLVTLDGVRQVLIYDAVGAGGYDATTGKELWRSPQWMNDTYNHIPQPIVLPDGSIFLSSGYGTGCILFDVKKSDSGWTTTTRWTAPNKFKLKFNTGVMRDGCVYGLDEGILSCLDLKTGKDRWKKGRYKYGQVLLLDNALFVISEDGDAILVEISPGSARELCRFHAIDGKTWNHPVISHGRLYVRNAEEAACYDLGALQTAAR